MGPGDQPQLLEDTLRRLSRPASARFRRFIVVEETGSTNELAWDSRTDEGADGTVVAAELQTGGKGRLGRLWASPSGNLHLTILRRMVEPVEKAGIVSLLAGIALCRAIEKVVGLRPSLKWPNDLLVRARKLAGILLEARENWQVVGVGVNVNTTIEHLPVELSDTATTLLLETGGQHDLCRLAAHFLAEFAGLETEFAGSRLLPVESYMEYFPFVGTAVAASFGAREIVGTIVEIGPDGALVLSGEDGRTCRVTSGEVTHVRHR